MPGHSGAFSGSTSIWRHDIALDTRTHTQGDRAEQCTIIAHRQNTKAEHQTLLWCMMCARNSLHWQLFGEGIAAGEEDGREESG